MIDLSQKSGLPVFLNDDGILSFSGPLKPVIPKARTIFDMKDYLADPNTIFSNGEQVYLMYRKVHLPQDHKKFEKMGIRYDLTLFKPGLIGQEFCKSIGHFHAKKPGTNVAFPEVYEVIYGHALFLIQKLEHPDSVNSFGRAHPDKNNDKISEIYLIEAEEGEKVIFPPGFGHTTINATSEILITANWDENTDSNYEYYRAHHGAGYYIIKDADGKPEFLPNPNYSNIPNLKKLKPLDLPYFGLYKGKPVYLTGQNSPDMLQFIITPELYLKQLTIENCYF